jgi:two-component system chemotaxis response regulator CheB
MRIFVVDGSDFCSDFYTQVFRDSTEFDFVGISKGGQEVISTITGLHPDIVLLDAELNNRPTPSDILKELRQQIPGVGILAMTTISSVTGNVLLNAGAFDCFIRPNKTCNEIKSGTVDEIDHYKNMLLLKLSTYCTRQLTQKTQNTFGIATLKVDTKFNNKKVLNGMYDVVAVGVSTGGPEALATFVSAIPEWFSLPIAITIHMPTGFTKTLAKDLSKVSKIPVTEAIDGEIVSSGHIYISPGGKHCGIIRDKEGNAHFELNDNPPENACKPSVDVLFRSVYNCWQGHAIVIMLTGMGSDGLEGYRKLKSAGAYTIAQDEASSVVWGMPGSVVNDGLASEVLPLQQIALRMAELSVERV